jgi:hypothetical protein
MGWLLFAQSLDLLSVMLNIRVSRWQLAAKERCRVTRDFGQLPLFDWRRIALDE